MFFYSVKDRNHHFTNIMVFVCKFCCLLIRPKQALIFMCQQYKLFENTVGKGEIVCNKQFLLFPKCFLCILRNFLQFSSNLKLLSANSLFWKGIKTQDQQDLVLIFCIFRYQCLFPAHCRALTQLP